MDNEAFVVAEEVNNWTTLNKLKAAVLTKWNKIYFLQQHSVNGPPSRRMSLIDTNSQNSFRLGRIQSSLRRLGMSMNLSRRGSTSTNTETVPRIANYRNFFNLRSPSRPTLDELHEPITRRPHVKDEKILRDAYRTLSNEFVSFFLENNSLLILMRTMSKNQLVTNLAGSRESSSETCWAFGVSCFSSESLGWWPFRESVSTKIIL